VFFIRYTRGVGSKMNRLYLICAPASRMPKICSYIFWPRGADPCLSAHALAVQAMTVFSSQGVDRLLQSICLLAAE
jgi:hypothetical protein